jgi:hypothetical protein
VKPASAKTAIRTFAVSRTVTSEVTRCGDVGRRMVDLDAAEDGAGGRGAEARGRGEAVGGDVRHRDPLWRPLMLW